MAQARADRAFLGRAIRYLAGDEGIRQFLDIGTGLPTADNTHEVAQRVAPESRIVYADNDPLVLLHARALLASTPQGACDYIEGDLRDPGKILAAAARTLDLTQPVALMLLGVLHHVPDTEQAYSIVRRLVAALAPGSFLTDQPLDERGLGRGDGGGGGALEPGRHTVDDAAHPHSRSAVSSTGWTCCRPGLSHVHAGVPAPRQVGGKPAEVDEFCGVARKP